MVYFITKIEKITSVGQNVYVSSSSDNSILIFNVDQTTGILSSRPRYWNASLANPSTITFTPDGKYLIVVGTSVATSLTRSGVDGSLTFYYRTSTTFPSSAMFAINASGSVYIVDGVQKIGTATISSGILTTKGANTMAGCNAPRKVVGCQDPYIFVDCGGTIRVLNSALSSLAQVSAPLSQLICVHSEMAYGTSSTNPQLTFLSFSSSAGTLSTSTMNIAAVATDLSEAPDMSLIGIGYKGSLEVYSRTWTDSLSLSTSFSLSRSENTRLTFSTNKFVYVVGMTSYHLYAYRLIDLDCPAGYATNVICDYCPAGTYSTGGIAGVCLTCPAGQFSAGGASQCFTPTTTTRLIGTIPVNNSQAKTSEVILGQPFVVQFLFNYTIQLNNSTHLPSFSFSNGAAIPAIIAMSNITVNAGNVSINLSPIFAAGNLSLTIPPGFLTSSSPPAPLSSFTWVGTTEDFPSISDMKLNGLSTTHVKFNSTQGGDLVEFYGSGLTRFGSVSVGFIDSVHPNNFCTIITANLTYLSCTAGAGSGANRSIVILSGMTALKVPSSFQASYPPPTITPGTLAIPGDPSRSVGGVVSPPVSNDGELLRFSGTNFGNDATLVTVTYGVFAYTCTVQLVQQTTLQCVTSQGAGTNMKFTVCVAGQCTNGVDTYTVLKLGADLVSASGCSSDPLNPARTVNCPTTGGSTLTICAVNLLVNRSVLTSVLVGGSPCGAVQLGPAGPGNCSIPSYYLNNTDINRLSCSLPAGVGTLQSVVITQSGVSSTPVALVSYIACTVSGLSSPDCTVDPSGNLVDCPIEGTIITVLGANFGDEGATVFINGNAVTTTHDPSAKNTRLYANLAPGFGVKIRLMVLQQMGQLTISPFSISYASCPLGQVYDSESIVCVPCAPGYYAGGSFLTLCSPCGPGSYAEGAGSSSCTQCAAGNYTTSYAAANCTLVPVGYFTEQIGSLIPSRCLPGAYTSSPGNSACTLCNPGQFQIQAGASFCDVCTRGKYSGGPGDQKCTPCESGKYVASNGSSVCTDCEEGKYGYVSDGDIFTGLTACLACAPGSSSSFLGAQICTTCASGTYAASSSAIVCSSCAPGQYALEGSTTCSNCSEGTYSPQASGACLFCDLGTYAPTEGLASCLRCPPSTFTDKDGEVSCTQCEAGKYSSVYLSTSCETCSEGKFSPTGSTTCTQCAPGTYNDLESQGVCPLCPAGTDSPFGSPACLPCAAGKYSRAGSVCQQCPDGTFSSANSSSCSTCPMAQTSQSGGSCTSCAPGKYGVSNGMCLQCASNTQNTQFGQTSCQPCQSGFIPSSTQSSCVETFSLERRQFLGVTFLACFIIFFAVAFTVLLLYLRLFKEEYYLVIYGYSPALMAASNVGVCAVCVSAILFIEKQSPTICILRPWFLLIGVTLIYAPVLLWNWRLHVIFNHKRLTAVDMTTQRLSLFILLPLAVDFLILGSWTGLVRYSVRSPTINECVPSRDDTGFWVCTFLAKLAVLAFGAYVVWKVRLLPPKYNHSMSLGLLIFGNLIVVATVWGLAVAHLTSTQANSTTVFKMTVGLLAIGVTWAAFFIPKLRLLFDHHYGLYKTKQKNAGSVQSFGSVSLGGEKSGEDIRTDMPETEFEQLYATTKIHVKNTQRKRARLEEQMLAVDETLADANWKLHRLNEFLEMKGKKQQNSKSSPHQTQGKTSTFSMADDVEGAQAEPSRMSNNSGPPSRHSDPHKRHLKVRSGSPKPINREPRVPSHGHRSPLHGKRSSDQGKKSTDGPPEPSPAIELAPVGGDTLLPPPSPVLSSTTNAHPPDPPIIDITVPLPDSAVRSEDL